MKSFVCTAVVFVTAGFGAAQDASAGGWVQLPRWGVGFTTHSAAYRQWGMPRMVNGLVSLGRCWNYSHPGRVLNYGDISKYGGGYFPPHVSHRNGVDVDMQPITTSGSAGYTYVGSWNYSRAYTSQLVWWMWRQSAFRVNVIFFNDSAIGGRTYWPGHANHLHMRIY